MATASRHVNAAWNGNPFQVCFCSCSLSVMAIRQSREWLHGKWAMVL